MKTKSYWMSLPARCDSEFTDYTDYTAPSLGRSYGDSMESYGDQSSVTSYYDQVGAAQFVPPVSHNADDGSADNNQNNYCSHPNENDRFEGVTSESIKAVSLSATMVSDAITSLTYSCVINPIKNCVPSPILKANDAIDDKSGAPPGPSRKSEQSKERDSSSVGSSSGNTAEMSQNSNGRGRTAAASKEGGKGKTKRFRSPFGFLRRGGGGGGGGGNDSADECSITSWNRRLKQGKIHVLNGKELSVPPSSDDTKKDDGNSEKCSWKIQPSRTNSPEIKEYPPPTDIDGDEDLLSLGSGGSKNSWNWKLQRRRKPQNETQLQLPCEEKKMVKKASTRNPLHKPRRNAPESPGSVRRKAVYEEQSKSLFRRSKLQFPKPSDKKQQEGEQQQKSLQSPRNRGLKRFNKTKPKSKLSDYREFDNDDEESHYYKKSEDISVHDNVHTIHVGRFN